MVLSGHFHTRIGLSPVITGWETEVGWAPHFSVNAAANKKRTTLQKAKETKEDQWRDFWMCETGTDQQVAQFLDSYIMMMKKKNPSRREEFNPGLLVRSQSLQPSTTNV
jgi:hypothetical protein